MVKELITDILNKAKQSVGSGPPGDPHREEIARFVERYQKEKGMHPEAGAVLPFMKGLGLDVGCGHSKTSPGAIGVDLTAGAEEGRFGCEEGHVSEADVKASGSHLPFKTGSLDYIVARHNLEHYQDTVSTLKEWARVLRRGGKAALVLPDDRDCDTIHLDPTHKHVFTPESFASLIGIMEEFRLEKVTPCIPHWSFLAVIERT